MAYEQWEKTLSTSECSWKTERNEQNPKVNENSKEHGYSFNSRNTQVAESREGSWDPGKELGRV